MIEDMYRENILDYYKNPRNYGELKNHTCKHKELNPLCGDEIEIQIIVKDKIVQDIKFNGKGCAISMASAGMLTEKVKGKTVEEVKKIKPDEIIEMLGIEISPVRMKCALLSLEVLHKCVYGGK